VNLLTRAIIVEFNGNNWLKESAKIKTAFPNMQVVKTLKTMHNAMTIDSKQLADGNHPVSIGGNDANASQISQNCANFH
jgi:hypothetical protein